MRMGMAMGGASLTVHPAGVAVHVMFFFPDGQANFGLVNDVAAGKKCFVAVRRCNPHPNGAVTECQTAFTMNECGVRHAKPFGGFGTTVMSFSSS